jgi:FkbM family methyltransferase
MNLKRRIFRIKRVLQEILVLRQNYYNWDSILKRAINGKYTVVLNHRSGVNFYNADNNTISIIKEVFVNKVYTKDSVMIKEGDIVFDVGANVGVFSIYASLIKNTNIVAFEPHPSNFEKLCHNVNQNEIRTINCLNYALGKENEERYMIEGNIPGGHKIANEKSSSNIENEGIKVKSLTLESIMTELNISKIDFLKLDCEGAEGEIINSLSLEGLKKINKMAIEFHNNHSILNHKEILKKLNRSGFNTSLKWDGNSYFGYIYAIR